MKRFILFVSMVSAIFLYSAFIKLGMIFIHKDFPLYVMGLAFVIFLWWIAGVKCKYDDKDKERQNER